MLHHVSTHTTPAVRACSSADPRITFHCTPTSASWNQVETWFGVLTRKAIRRWSFRSGKELVAMIDAFTRQWTRAPAPSLGSNDEILAKAVRKPRATSQSGRYPIGLKQHL